MIILKSLNQRFSFHNSATEIAFSFQNWNAWIVCIHVWKCLHILSMFNPLSRTAIVEMLIEFYSSVIFSFIWWVHTRHHDDTHTHTRLLCFMLNEWKYSCPPVFPPLFIISHLIFVARVQLDFRAFFTNIIGSHFVCGKNA